MVQIHVNQVQDKQFLYDCSSTSRIDSLTRNITQIYNLQSKIQSLVLAVEERVLASREDCHSDAALALMRALSEAKAYISKDQVLHKKQLSPYVLKDHVQNIEKEVIAYQSVALKDSDLLQLTSASHINFKGLFRCHLEIVGRTISRLRKSKANFKQEGFLFAERWGKTDTELLNEDTAQLWWAGKELKRDKQLCDYIGKNEKTKIIVKLQSPGLGSSQLS